MMRILWIVVVIGLASCKDKAAPSPTRSTTSDTVHTASDGAIRNLHSNGNVREEATMANGVLTGVRRLYREDGTLEIEENYAANGMLDGEYKVYYADGKNIEILKIYRNNVSDGILKVYYQDGKIKEEVTILDNEENGPFTEYYNNGQIHWKGTYRKGDNEYGELIEYDSLGTMIKKMMCDSMAICRTTWKNKNKK
jgi:antitoxin component YwqK of YwqJK toxin-antitoxin module